MLLNQGVQNLVCLELMCYSSKFKIGLPNLKRLGVKRHKMHPLPYRSLYARFKNEYFM